MVLPTWLCLSLACVSGVLGRQVNVEVNASESIGHLPPFNQFFGCDEPSKSAIISILCISLDSEDSFHALDRGQPSPLYRSY